MGYIFGSDNYQLLTKSDILAYENSSTFIFTQAGLDLSNNSQILRKPHIQSGWLTSTVNNNWSNDQLLRKCDIYRTVSGKLQAGNYSYETWVIVFAIMIFDDKDNIMTTLRQNYIDGNNTSGEQTRLHRNYKSLFTQGQLEVGIDGYTINNRSVSYIKYNSEDFKAAGAFEMYFSNMTSSGTNISEWTNPVLIGVVQCKGFNYGVNSYYINKYGVYSDTSFTTFLSLADQLKLNGVSFGDNSIKVFDMGTVSGTINLVGNTGNDNKNAYYYFIQCPVDLNNTYFITWSST